ncbi:Hsp70 family protein, partial [Acidithiobacillus sp.]|uniref:Hsp70 family protein n=1 Tax=Acidithiobacillus sp. TaxID=1872118 RepID=UPI002628AE70
PGMVKIRTIAGDKSPVEIAAEILTTLKNRAEASLGGPLTGVVITVPAYFDDAQRQATRDAARLAGLQVLRLLNEPTAAAIAYGLDQAIQGTYAIYDLGGGTFDISILRLSQGVFEVLSTHGDAALGGDDFDRRIADWISQQCPSANLSISDRQQLLHHAKNAKEYLSDTDIAPIAFELSDGTNIRLQLDRA